MANPFTTSDDLKLQSLWAAGEPADGTSDYDSKVMDYLQLIYDTLLNGGTLGTRDIATSAGLYSHVVDIPITDWYWLRKHPPFAFITTPAILGSAAAVSQSTPPPTVIGDVTATNGSPTIAFSLAPAVSVAGWRLKLLNQAQGISNAPITVPRITTHTAGAASATIDVNWPQETQAVANFVLFQAEYPLPSDFVRFCEAPFVQGGYAGGNPSRLDIGSSEQVGDYWPLTEINQGPPSAAARITDALIQLNRWDTQSYRIEFSYIYTPPALALAQSPTLQQPVVPLRYRHMLAIGAAMLIMQDKSDARDVKLASEIREIIANMGHEFRREQGSGSELAGRHLYRRGSSTRRGLLRTSSGLVLG